MAVSNRIVEELVTKGRINRIPIKSSFELLPVCNLNCKMCYIRSSWQEVDKKGGLKTVEEWLEMAKQLKEAGTLFLLLTGGEVFLYPNFKKLYIELYKMGFVLTINTNATMINEETVSWLSQYPPRCVSISLYGASNETYERLCGAKGMFDKVIHAIKILQEKEINIECKSILTPLNYKDLDNMWKYVQQNNVYYEAATYSYPPVRKLCNEKQVRFNAKEAARCMFYRNKVMTDNEGYAEEICKYIKKYEKTKEIPGKVQKGLTCNAGNASCWITWQGKLLPCALMYEPYEFPFEIGFQKAWSNLKQKVDQITLSAECAHCGKRQICHICPASAHAETGSFDGTSQYHCDMTNELLKEMYKFIEENNINLDDYNDNGERK